MLLARTGALPLAPYKAARLPARSTALAGSAGPALYGQACPAPARLGQQAYRAQQQAAHTRSVRAQAGVQGDLSEQDAKFLRTVGWISFWAQLALTVVSAIVLSFTVGSSMQGPLPDLPVIFTLLGVASSFISTFLAYSFTRVARKTLFGGDSVAKSGVLQSALNVTRINLFGLFVTIIGLQASVGGLVAKTLTSSTSNPYQAGQAARNAPTSLDVFSVQAATNVLLAAFLSLFFANWLVRKLNAGASPASGSGQFMSKSA